MAKKKTDQNLKNGETAYYDAEAVRRHSEMLKEKKARRRQTLVLYAVCVLLVSCLLGGVGWLLANDMCSLNKDYVETTLTVEEDDTVRDVSKKLKDEGLIDYRWFFHFTGGFFDAAEMIDPGEWVLNSKMDYRALIHEMHNYEMDRVEDDGWIQVVIPEGMTVAEVITLLSEKGVADKAELEDAMANYEFQDYSFLNEDMLGDVKRMEGYLFPDTYFFDPEKSAVYQVDSMLDKFVKQFDETLLDDIRSSPYTWEEIIIMASLIEKESVGDDEERRNISSVLHNRLENPISETGNQLQLCSTVYYAMALEGVETFDTTVDNEYNTYIHSGMPPAPICNPGMSAIRAAVYPADTDYYYFALGQDDVSHFFTNYDDHVNFVNSDMYKPVG